MKTVAEAAGVLLIGAVVGLCFAVFVLIRSAQVAWDLLGDDDDGQHRS